MKLLNLLGLAFIIISCESSLENKLKKLSKPELYGNSSSGWILQQEIDDTFIIYKYDGDTLKSFVFTLDENEVPKVNEYEIEYPCTKTDTCYVQLIAHDTMYVYRKSNGTRIFEVGEYQYRYNHEPFTEAELEFFYKHGDSLRKVRGNNLPSFLNE